ncbi:putative transcription factor C2H2 family [Helianthus annuus]|nr:putative transcription factor C2H2 family [Helianthus annuus]
MRQKHTPLSPSLYISLSLTHLSLTLSLYISIDQALAPSIGTQKISHLMMGSGRTKENGKAPAYASSISPNTHPPSSMTLLDGNVNEENFDSILDMPFSIAGWEDIHRAVAQGPPETIRNPRAYSTDRNSFQNPQINPSSNSSNTNLQAVPLLPEWNMGWGQQYMNQGNNGESSFGSFNRPEVNRDVTGSSSVYFPIDTAPVHTRNNVNLNTNQSGFQGKFEGSFLSLGLGGTSDTVSSSQLDSREISNKLKEAASNELKIARMGSQINYSGFSNQYSHVGRMAPTINEFGSPSTELKMVNARKATGQTVDADFMGFQRNNSGFPNQFSNVDRMPSINYEAGVHSTLNSGLGSSRQSILHMQQHDNRNIRSGDMDRYKGNQPVHPATLGGNSAHFNSRQHNLKPESVKPSWMTSNHTPSEQLQYVRSTTANIPNFAGQAISQNATPNQVLGGNQYSQRTKTPQVSWVGCGPAGLNAPFPKRLGVESSVRSSPQSSQGHLSPMGTSLQTTNPGQNCQFSDKGSTQMPHNVLRPIGRSDGAPVTYPMSFQEPFFAYGQTENALIQRPKGTQGAPSSSTNDLSVDSQPQKFDFRVRSHHKRTAVAPQSASHWVKRQKMIHPTVHHSMPKPPVPVTSPLVHPSIPVRSRTQYAGHGAARVPPVIPCVSNAKARVPVASAPAVSYIKWKDPNATSKPSGHKCFLCKRDVAFTSEGDVFQPAVPPPVAVLPCGHTFHDQCLQNITPDDQAKDPPCIPCALEIKLNLKIRALCLKLGPGSWFVEKSLSLKLGVFINY